MTPESDFWSLVGQSADHGRFRQEPQGARSFDIPPGRVHTLLGGRVVGSDGWVIDADDRLLIDLSPDYLRERYVVGRHPLMMRWRLPKVTNFDGRVAVLATLSARDFYGHWMMDLLPRARMIEASGVSLQHFDGIYLPAPRQPYQVELLSRLGIRSDQIVDSETVPHLRAAELVVPSHHPNVFMASKWCCETLRGLANPEGGSLENRPRIYISRAGTDHRRLVNEQELVDDLLGPLGFASVRPETMSQDAQVAMFAAAEIVVTPLGSSVANLVHCRPGTQIVEIMNPRCVQTCALSIAAQLGVGHHVVLAPGVDGTVHEILEDLMVPLWALRRGLDFAFAARSSFSAS